MTQNNSLNKFKAAFKGGTRANRFKVIPSFPNGIANAGAAQNKAAYTKQHIQSHQLHFQKLMLVL